MGQAKLRRIEIGRGPCLCGDGLIAAECCFDGRGWHRKPAIIRLSGETGFSHKDCYLRELGNCSDKISREHLVSEAVLRVIYKDGLLASGLPWMKEGDHKIGLNTIVGKCLCTAHNSALSPLDATAAKFFAALEDCDLHREGESRRYLFNGHDIERWLLKTLAGFSASTGLRSNGERLSGSFHPAVSVAQMLEDSSVWPATSGLYFTQKLGKTFSRGDHFRFAPLSNEAGELAGLLVSIQGFQFSCLAVPTQATPELAKKNGVYRPERIVFRMPKVTNMIELSWESPSRRIQITATFEMTEAERRARGLPRPKNTV